MGASAYRLPAELDALHRGEVSFEEFHRRTRGEWRALAKTISSRWRLPASMDEEDLQQEMLAILPGLLRSWQPERQSLLKYVTWQVLYQAKRALHRERKALRLCGKAQSRAALPLSSIQHADETYVDALDRVQAHAPPPQLAVEQLLDALEQDGERAKRAMLEAIDGGANYRSMLRQLRDNGSLQPEVLERLNKDQRGKRPEMDQGIKEAVGELKLDEVNVELLKEHLEELGVEPSSNDPAKLGAALLGYYKEQAVAGNVLTHVQCDRCNGYSDDRLDACPYCGDADDEEAESAALSSQPNGSDTAPAVEEPAAKGSVKGTAKKTKPKKRSTASESAKAQKPKKASEKKASEKKAQKPKKASEKKAQKPKKASEKKASEKKASEKKDELAEVPAEVLTVADLDAQCEIVKRGGRMAASQLWEVGQALLKIKLEHLWKLRLTRGKVPKYSNFKVFVAEEFGISHTHAYTLMSVAERFSAKEVERFGVNKLKLALSAPADRQQEVLDAAANGESKGALRERINGNGMPPAKPITVALVPGVMQVPAYVRPGQGQTFGKPTKPARLLDEDPWTMVKLDNSVELFIKTTRNAKGEIEFLIEAKRVS